MEKLIRGLRHFRDHVMWEKGDLFENSTEDQHPLAMLICCSDSRVLPEALMQADPGDLFISRNAGNLVPPPNASGGEGATIEYAVVALGVKDIVVCGHYRCGAVRALLDNKLITNLPMMTEWLSNAAEARELLNCDRRSVYEDPVLWDRAVEHNVLVQVKNLKQHPSVAKALAEGKLQVHGWVLRFETGEVLAYDSEEKAFSPLLEMSEIHAALGGRDTASEHAASPSSQPKQRRPAAVISKPLSWLDILRSDLPASMVVFMVALPLCLAIAKACGAPPEAGLITGIVGGCLVGLVAGSPLQVSGPAAGLLVILLDIVHDHGLATLGVITLLAGLIQLVAAGFKLGQWFRAISPAVILGMLAGIGGVIFAQQFHMMVDDSPERSTLANILNIPKSIYLGLSNDPNLPPEHRPAALIGMLTLGILLTWKAFVPQRLKVIPSVLVAVVVATILATVLNLPIQRVDFDHLSRGIQWIDFSSVPSMLTNRAIWIAAATIALVASAETLLCAAAIDQMHKGPRTKFDRELGSQGIGNAICGMLGSLPMTGVIVRSSVNVQAGARTRLSTVFHGIWLLIFVWFFPDVLRMIPTACLAATLVLTGIKLIEIHAIRRLWNESRAEALICVATALTVVFADLLIGVILGVVLSVAKLMYTVSRLRITRRDDPAHDRVSLRLEGSATFIKLPKLAAALEEIPPGVTLHVDFDHLDYIDHACLTLIMNWEKQHEATGGQLVIDWDTLRGRFEQRGKRKKTSTARKVVVT